MSFVLRQQLEGQRGRDRHVPPVVVDVAVGHDPVSSDREFSHGHLERLAGAVEGVSPIGEGERESPKVQEVPLKDKTGLRRRIVRGFRNQVVLVRRAASAEANQRALAIDVLDAELLQNPNFCAWLKVTDVFVASHHGRVAGYCGEVFELCKPRLIIVSDGPETDTSAVSRYSQKASGWKVKSRSTQEMTSRQVVTTRTDGSIFAETGVNGSTKFLAVSIK